MNFTKKFRVFLNNLLRSKRILLDFWAEVNENRAYYSMKLCELCSIGIIGASVAVLFWEVGVHKSPQEANLRLFYGLICSVLFTMGAWLACCFEERAKWFIIPEEPKIVQKTNIS